MAVPNTIRSFLNVHKIPYHAIHHERDFTAQETAHDTHTPGKDFAKTVVLYVDNNYCLAVLPAVDKLDLDKVKSELNVNDVGLATEDEISSICGNCEVGAMSPFGNLYNLPVYVSHHLAKDHMITFDAGTHEDAIRLQYEDYEELVKPVVLDITQN
ncbi:YbaK/EbsC family protein [bacterium]|nr:YbaK/EbsC family protein [bacterium]